jgi:hypothetical protein
VVCLATSGNKKVVRAASHGVRKRASYEDGPGPSLDVDLISAVESAEPLIPLADWGAAHGGDVAAARARARRKDRSNGVHRTE